MSDSLLGELSSYQRSVQQPTKTNTLLSEKSWKEYSNRKQAFTKKYTIKKTSTEVINKKSSQRSVGILQETSTSKSDLTNKHVIKNSSQVKKDTTSNKKNTPSNEPIQQSNKQATDYAWIRQNRDSILTDKKPHEPKKPSILEPIPSITPSLI